jgi:hypothetical protein
VSDYFLHRPTVGAFLLHPPNARTVNRSEIVRFYDTD